MMTKNIITASDGDIEKGQEQEMWKINYESELHALSLSWMHLLYVCQL